jgi:hypothetical protein
VRRLQYRDRTNRYVSISTDSLTRPLEALLINLTASDVPRSLAACGVEADHIRSIEARVFDHGVMIVSCILDIQDTSLPSEESDLKVALDAWQESGVALCTALAAEVHTTIVAPLIDSLRAADSRGRFLVRARRTDQAVAYGDPPHSRVSPRDHHALAQGRPGRRGPRGADATTHLVRR